MALFPISQQTLWNRDRLHVFMAIPIKKQTMKISWKSDDIFKVMTIFLTFKCDALVIITDNSHVGSRFHCTCTKKDTVTVRENKIKKKTFPTYWPTSKMRLKSETRLFIQALNFGG